MIKIKRGNDARFNVMLQGEYTFNQNNIKRIQSTFIKSDVKKYTSVREELEDRLTDLYSKDSYMLDFDNLWYPNNELEQFVSWDLPDECDMHLPNKYCTHICGPHGYHTGAWNAINNPQFGKRALYEMGVRKGMLYGDLLDKDAFAEWALRMCPKIRKPGEVCPAYSSTTDKENQIHVYFPAKEQKSCGKYNLVIKILAYEDGWGPSNLRTYTMEYKNLVELSDDEDGIYPNVTIDIDENGDMYQVSVAVLDMVPPTAEANNVDLSDQSFEDDATIQTKYSYDELISRFSEFTTKNITDKQVTFSISSDQAKDYSQNFIYIMSTKPISSVSFGNWNVSCPYVQISEKSGEYIYAISNPISNVSGIKLNVYFK